MTSAAPWGYLLPLRDGPPPLELTRDNVTVGTSNKCTLQVDGALLGLPAGSAQQTLFAVRRDDESASRVRLRSESHDVWMEWKQLPRWHVESLHHGARIGFDAKQATYVFVNPEVSNSFRAPRDVQTEYWVGHCLGRGGFGKVYLLFHKKMNYQRKAMKIVEPRSEKESHCVKREARILMSLNHPCVIETYSTPQLGNQQFLVMEYMAGGDLRQYVNDQCLMTEAQTKLIFFQLALAVEYLHEKHICHRDVSPANILLQKRSPKTLIKLADIGLAKDRNIDSTLKTSAGTRNYLAPEIAREEKPYTNSVDIWSMGIILFYSLTGTLPFRSIYEGLLRRYKVEYIPTHWYKVSAQAQALVKRMLKAEAADRVTASQVVHDPWLRDDTMRKDAFKLPGLHEYLASHGHSSELLPWSYLLPLRDGIPPMELKLDTTTVGSDKSCTLHLDAAKVCLPSFSEPQNIFTVIRDTDGKAFLRSEVEHVSVNGKELKRCKDEILQHGARIAIVTNEVVYEYVNRKESDSFNAPRDLLEDYLVGGFRNVYIIFDKNLKYQRKAMKIVEPKKKTNLLMSLKYPCIVQTFSIQEMGKKQFLIMEHMSGGNLCQYVNYQRPLSENQMKLIFFQLALAVQYLHERKICHRNLKPSSVLFRDHNPHTLIKLTAFDVAKEGDFSTVGLSADAKFYVAPELLFNDTYTISVDVWSMGVLLFYSMIGALPFKSIGEAQRCGYVVKYASERWSGLSSEAQALMRRMLKVEATDRASVSQVIEDPWLRDRAMRKEVFQLTGIQNCLASRNYGNPLPSSGRSGLMSPWGYLLPLRDNLPSLELRHEIEKVVSNGSCTVSELIFCEISQSISSGNALLNVVSNGLCLDGKQMHRGDITYLTHGAKIGIGAGEETYVFVSREESDSFRAPPDLLERYLVGHFLGGGHFGKAYILFDKDSDFGRKAMKIDEPKNEVHHLFVEREAKMMMTLNHPCIIKTFSIQKYEFRYFHVMEYVGGGNLSQFVNEQHLLSEAQTKLLFFQLALAVKYLHGKKICHRSLNPHSVLMQCRNPYTLIKLSGFSFAKDEIDDSPMKTTVGAIPYFAPEIISEENCYTNSVDVWSMGVILFYSLTGALPFKSLNKALRRRHAVKYVRASWRGVSTQAQQLVKSMLKVKAADRVSVLQVVGHDWLQDLAMREDVHRLVEQTGGRWPSLYSESVVRISTASSTNEDFIDSQPIAEREEAIKDSTQHSQRRRRTLECSLS